MAEPVNDARKNDRINVYNEFRARVHGFVSTLVKSITSDLFYDEKKRAERLDLFFKLMGHKMAEAKRLEENAVAGDALANETYQDVKTSLDFYFENLLKILNAPMSVSDKEMILAKLEKLPEFQKSTFRCVLVECHNKKAWTNLFRFNACSSFHQ